MGTFMANAQTITRKWYVIDATNKPLGRIAAQAATILNGKHKVDFTAHADCGDHVIIVNASKVLLTGKKLEQKIYYHHSGYFGGLKETKYSALMKTKPEMAVRLAVKGMLPKNNIGVSSLKRLRVFKGENHTHVAQKPEALNV